MLMARRPAGHISIYVYHGTTINKWGPILSSPIKSLPRNYVYSTFRGPGMVTTMTDATSQAKPYDLPAPYLRRSTTMVSGSTTGMKINGPKNGYPSWMETSITGAPQAVVGWNLFDHAKVVQAREVALSKARSMLKDALGQRAEWLVNLAQQRQALTMITTRTQQLNNAAEATLRFARHPVKGAKALASLIAAFPKELRAKGRFSTITKQWRNRSADAGALWLELHFGWEQLVKDVYAAACIFTDPPPNGRVRVRTPWVNNSWSQSASNLPYFSVKGDFKIQSRASITCHAEITNLNGFRQASLGLANPAVVLWDMVPWSFVIDWFANVSAYLSQPTDFLGVKFSKPSHNVLTKATGYGTATQGGSNGPGNATAVSNGYEFRRYTGLPSVNLVAIPINYPSPIRAITAIALLLTTFRRKAWQY